MVDAEKRKCEAQDMDVSGIDFDDEMVGGCDVKVKNYIVPSTQGSSGSSTTFSQRQYVSEAVTILRHFGQCYNYSLKQ